jgi:RNA polymerase subunit RPABC4/transcription elongation factor Spt4
MLLQSVPFFWLVFWVAATWAPEHSPALRTGPEERRLRFSHPLHLGEAGMECADCHTSIAASTAAEDLNFPGMESCGRCHDVTSVEGCPVCHDDPASVPPRGNRWTNLIFDHRRHIAIEGSQPGRALPPSQLGENESTLCESCHHAMREALITGPENYPKMSHCLSCHQPARDAMRTCKTCHADTRNLVPPDHRVSTFFDDHAQMVAETGSTACRICHTPGYNPCSQCH